LLRKVIKMKTLLRAIVILILLLPLVFGCSKRALVSQSHFDTVTSHFDQGMRELEAGRVEKAKWEFERAQGLDDKSPLPKVGLALVEMKLGHRDEAFNYIKKALKKDSKCVKAYIARAQVRMNFQKDKDWYKKALDDLKKAKEISPKNAEIYFVEGKLNEAAFLLDPAERAFSKVLELKSGYEKRSNHELEKIHKIKRAAPGTKIGMKIGLVEQITRAETAVLFIEELRLVDLIKRNEKPQVDVSFKEPDDSREMEVEKVVRLAEATDIANHWAKNYIEEILKLKIRGLTAYPDHTFKPDDPLTRAEYALLMEDLLIKLLGDKDLATKYIGKPSPFPDVGSSHFAYNAINVCVEKGIMKADLKNNLFHPADTVSGADALLMIKALQDELRTRF